MAPKRFRAADLEALASAVRERARALAHPCIVALDGRSGVGKSTLAGQLGTLLDAAVIDGDDFFAGGVAIRSDTPADRARDCIDWCRQRTVLEALRAGRTATYLAFDWDTFDGRLEQVPTRVEPRSFVIVEGVYSARPELAEWLDLRVLLRATEASRFRRLLAREGSIGPWERQWHEAEDWYFENAAPTASFHVVIDAEG